MFKNNKYNITAVLLWMTYFCHGMQAIIISQNASFFAGKWGVEAATVFAVIAWTGLGKILFLSFAGLLSDKFGRKPIVLLGLLGYVLMFGTFLIARDIWTANILAFIGGAMTSLYDGSINPALFEIYPKDKATASLLSKTFISISSMLYPLLVAFLVSHNMPSEIGIMVPFVLTSLVLIGVLVSPFPDNDIRKNKKISAREAIQVLEVNQSIQQKEANSEKLGYQDKAKFAIDGLAFSAFAFTIYSTFYLFQQASKLYAQQVIHMSETAAASVTAYYQLGGLLATLVFSVLMARGIRDIVLLVFSPIFAALAALLVYFMPGAITLTFAGIIIGFFAGGGLLQIGNAVLNQFFDKNKGRNTSIYYFVMAIGSYLVPLLASKLIALNRVDLIMLFVSLCGFASAGLMIFMGKRYSHIFGVSIFSSSKRR
ncbi:MFS transporter [Streptococcus didelphis]|uniref:MFS transporter n=1 Tax=Streptococcus didelphis TaxID=102886 RepID=UPI000375D979|nr:MFS transporter [Streptococcus didelphis]